MDPCPQPTAPRYRRPPGWACYPLLFLLAVGLYAAFAQHTFYKTSGQHIVLQMMQREAATPRHAVLVSILIGLLDLWRAVGLPAVTEYQLAVGFSACSGAVATVLLHATARRLDLPGALPWYAALLGMTAPAPFFFATVVEVHAFNSVLMALALWCATRMAQRPGVWSAVSLGLVMLLATASHASGVLLPALCLPWALVVRAGPRRLHSALIALGLFVALVPLWHLALDQMCAAPRGSGWFALFTLPGELPGKLMKFPEVLWREFLRPCFPLYLLGPLAFFLRDCLARRLFLGSAPGLLAYLLLTTLSCSTEPEWGAYMIPMCGPLAIASVAACSALSPGRLGHLLATVLLAVSLVAGIATINQHDRPGTHRQWVAALLAVAEGQPSYVWVGRSHELDALLLAGGPVPFGNVDQVLSLDPARAANLLTADLTARLLRGERVVVTRTALEELRTSQEPQARAALRVLQDWPADPLDHRGLDAVLLRRP